MGDRPSSSPCSGSYAHCMALKWYREGLVVVQTLSYESWEANMWDNIDAEHQYASIYYILLILAGPFILINVFIAAISSVFLQLRRKNDVNLLLLVTVSNAHCWFTTLLAIYRLEPAFCGLCLLA